MKNVKLNLLWVGMIGLLFAVTSCEKDNLQNDLVDASAKKTLDVMDCSNTVDLVAGRDLQVVGSVSVDITFDEATSKNIIVVTYNTIDEWVISQTHVQLFSDNETFDDVPLTKKGSPKIGLFDYTADHDYVNQVVVVIDDYNILDNMFVAAHAVVSKLDGISDVEMTLPDQVNFEAKLGTTFGYPSYLDAYVSGGTILDGTYDGYCIDLDLNLYPSTIFTADVFSSYEDLGTIVEHPENMDLVNWIINQEYTTKSPACLDRNFTYGDIQVAIWTLIDDSQIETNGLEEFNQCAVDEIIAAAQANGEGFVPGCGEKMVIVLKPVTPVQSIIIWKEVPCGGEETAWGKGVEFPGDDWSMYFKACIN